MEKPKVIEFKPSLLVLLKASLQLQKTKLLQSPGTDRA